MKDRGYEGASNMLDEYQSLLDLCDHPDATVNGIKAVIKARMAGLAHYFNPEQKGKQ